MATRATRRRPNKQRLVKGLEKAASNASKRAVYSIKETGDTYAIVNYMTGKLILEDLPGANIAKRVCEKYNADIPISKKFHAQLKLFYKHSMDLDVYKYNFDLTEDVERKAILSHRIGVSYQLMKKAKADLFTILCFLINKCN